MFAHAVNPILNVSNFQESVEWFAKIGFKKMWDWGDPPGFGAVKSGAVEIFLCQGGQGGRGKSPVKMIFGPWCCPAKTLASSIPFRSGI